MAYQDDVERYGQEIMDKWTGIPAPCAIDDRSAMAYGWGMSETEHANMKAQHKEQQDKYGVP